MRGQKCQSPHVVRDINPKIVLYDAVALYGPPLVMSVMSGFTSKTHELLILLAWPFMMVAFPAVLAGLKIPWLVVVLSSVVLYTLSLWARIKVPKLVYVVPSCLFAWSVTVAALAGRTV